MFLVLSERFAHLSSELSLNVLCLCNVADSGQQSLRVVTDDENKCTDYSRPVEKKGGYGTLLR